MNSPSLMHEAGYSMPVHWGNPEGWDGEGGGGGFMVGGNTCTPMADSCQCVTKPLQYCKVISLQLNKLKKNKNLNSFLVLGPLDSMHSYLFGFLDADLKI